jgi:hypothetical protein
MSCAPDQSAAWQRERGQVAFLVLVAIVGLAPLLGLVVNAGRVARAKVETQNVVDKAACAGAGTSARLLNLLSNCNVALLDLTALMAMMDAVEPTYEAGMWVLFWEEIASSLWGGSGTSIKIAQERQVLQMFRTVGNAYARLRPQVDALRRVVERMEREVERVLPTAPTAAGLAAAAAEPGAVRVIPAPSVGRFPIQRERLWYYRDKGHDRLRAMDAPVFWQLVATTSLSGAWHVWREETWRRYRRLAQRNAPQVTAFDRRPERVTRSFTDRHFRFAWSGERPAERLTMTGVFGVRAHVPTLALAEAKVGNPVRFDLVTPRWDAVLVPVTKHPLARVHPVQH